MFSTLIIHFFSRFGIVAGRASNGKDLLASLLIRIAAGKVMSLLTKHINRKSLDFGMRWRNTAMLLVVFILTLGASSTPSEPEAEFDRVVVPIALPSETAVSEHWSVERYRFAYKLNRAFGLKLTVASEFSDWIIEASERQKLDPNLIASLVFTESTFRKHVTSVWGAVGPAQIRIDYWQNFCGATDLNDPEENVYCGAQILAHFLDVCGHQNCALRSYNLGFRNRNNSYFAGAGDRYLAKIESNKNVLDQLPL